MTLGQKLAPVEPVKPPVKPLPKPSVRPRSRLSVVLDLCLLTAISFLLFLWLLMGLDTDTFVMMAILTALIAVWVFIYGRRRASEPLKRKPLSKTHSLLANDRQGFMSNLRLDAKTVIFDGSNIYYFGRNNGLDAQPLGMLADALRGEGYRIVCFFDANIYFTLNEHGAFPRNQPHTVPLLEDIFGLTRDEIYVVPSGDQADKYILDSLKHLPISFAVTNDQFRDYARRYPSVMKGNQWRKGVVISKNEIKLLQHRLQNPIRLQ